MSKVKISVTVEEATLQVARNAVGRGEASSLSSLVEASMDAYFKDRLNHRLVIQCLDNGRESFTLEREGRPFLEIFGHPKHTSPRTAVRVEVSVPHGLDPENLSDLLLGRKAKGAKEDGHCWDLSGGVVVWTANPSVKKSVIRGALARSVEAMKAVPFWRQSEISGLSCGYPACSAPLMNLRVWDENLLSRFDHVETACVRGHWTPSPEVAERLSLYRGKSSVQ